MQPWERAYATATAKPSTPAPVVASADASLPPWERAYQNAVAQTPPVDLGDEALRTLTTAGLDRANLSRKELDTAKAASGNAPIIGPLVTGARNLIDTGIQKAQPLLGDTVSGILSDIFGQGAPRAEHEQVFNQLLQENAPQTAAGRVAAGVGGLGLEAPEFALGGEAVAPLAAAAKVLPTLGRVLPPVISGSGMFAAPSAMQGDDPRTVAEQATLGGLTGGAGELAPTGLKTLAEVGALGGGQAALEGAPTPQSLGELLGTLVSMKLAHHAISKGSSVAGDIGDAVREGTLQPPTEPVQPTRPVEPVPAVEPQIAQTAPQAAPEQAQAHDLGQQIAAEMLSRMQPQAASVQRPAASEQRPQIPLAGAEVSRETLPEAGKTPTESVLPQVEEPPIVPVRGSPEIQRQGQEALQSLPVEQAAQGRSLLPAVSRPQDAGVAVEASAKPDADGLTPTPKGWLTATHADDKGGSVTFDIAPPGAINTSKGQDHYRASFDAKRGSVVVPKRILGWYKTEAEARQAYRDELTRQNIELPKQETPQAAPVEQAAPEQAKPAQAAEVTPFQQRVEKHAPHLRRMADEAGWEVRGGSIIRDGKNANAHQEQYYPQRAGDVIGRTKWIPKMPWFEDAQREAKLPGNFNGDATVKAVEKALAGKKLGKAQERHVNWILDHIEFEAREAAEEHGITDYNPLAAEQASAVESNGELHPIDVAIVDKARAIDEAAFETAVERYGEDDAAFMAEMNRIIEEKPNEQSETVSAGGEAVPQPENIDAAPAATQADEAAGRSAGTEGSGQTRSSGPRVDLFGQDTSNAQALADRGRAVDEKLGKGKEQPSADTGGGLFSQETKQRDIADVIAEQPASKPKPAEPKEAAPEPVEEPIEQAPPELTSTRKAMVEEDRASLGIEGLDSPERRTREQDYAEAREQKMPDKALELAVEVLNNPRSLTTTERAGITLRMVEIKNEIKKQTALLNGKDEAARKFAEAEIDALQGEFDIITKASVEAGSIAGQQLQAHQHTLNQDFDLVTMMHRAREAKGEELTPKEKADYRKMSEDFEKMSERITALEQKIADGGAERSVASSKERGPGSKQNREKLTAKLKDLLEGGCKN